NSTYSTIDPGFRGEYTLVPQPRTTLYFSPIDHRLHLLNATAGVWNDANQREVRYQTLGTPYVVRWDARDIASDFHGTPDDASKLTAWNLDRQQEQPESLTFAGGQLVLATSTGVYVKNGPDQSSEFETAPPVDHASWLTLKDQLQPRQATFAGTDLQAMFDQFPATTQSVSGGRLRDFRLVAGGFRFILDVPTLGSTANWLAGKPIGSYLVEFQNGAYSATSLTPAAVAVSGVSTSAQRPIALNPLELTATLQNSGGDDAPYQVVSFTATNGSQNMDLGAVMISVLAGGGAQATVSWVPPSAGRWQISAQAAGGSARSQTTVDVTAPPTTSLPGMLTVQRLPVDGQAAVGIVLGVALLTAVSLGLLSWRHVPGYRVGADRLD
ncbi:MAG: hypothetical protein JOZ39_03945, partial [Chloroflexi bacterium]|nr:hypothetical protein [Chloroflexota bacterium]